MALSVLKSKQRKKEIVIRSTVSIRKIQTDYLREAKLFLVTSVFKMIPWLLITTLRGVFIQFLKLHKGIDKMVYFTVASISKHSYHFSSHFGLEKQKRINLFCMCFYNL